MSNYSRGRALEYEIKKVLEEAGYSVIRGSSSKGEVAFPGSGSVKCDLVASKQSRSNKDTVYMLLIQCKRSKKN